jgi:hypothetical protein
MTPTSGPSSPQGDLQRIRLQLESTNPELYRQLALYLQVLRQILPHSVDQACFHLATQVQPGRYTSLAEAQRRRFHVKISALVARCTSLLTVEQLAGLAGRIAREEALQADRFLREPPVSPNRTHPSDREARLESHRSELDSPPAPEGVAPNRPPDEGSVHLGLDLPIEGGWLGWGDVPGFGFADSAPEAVAGDPEDSDAFPPELADADEEATASDLFSLFSALAAAAGLDRGIRGLELSSDQGMTEFAAQIDADGETAGERLSDEADESGAAGERPGEMAFPFRFRALALEAAARERSMPGHFREDDPGALFRPPDGGGLLPRDPVALLAWLEGMELALARQLRDLSHALNRELLHCGLIRILLPLNLLDGVLSGQIEVQSSHPNLLQLPLPLPSGRSGRVLRAQAILLRRADLELEQPRLRTMRSRLQQLRQEGRRMAQQYHRLQRRIQAHEAEALWLQDIRLMRPGPDHPP